MVDSGSKEARIYLLDTFEEVDKTVTIDSESLTLFESYGAPIKINDGVGYLYTVGVDRSLHVRCTTKILSIVDLEKVSKLTISKLETGKIIGIIS